MKKIFKKTEGILMKKIKNDEIMLKNDEKC